MTDVEKLLRDTLADPRHRVEPLPGMYDGVRERAHQRRQRVVRLASALTVVVVIAGVATAVRLNTVTPRKGLPATSLSASPPAHGQFSRFDIGAGSTGALAVTPSTIFLAQTDPNGLVDVSPSDLSVAKQIATPEAPDGTAVDRVAGLVWIWSSTQSPVASSDSSPDSTSIQAYQTSTFATDRAVSLPAYTFSAVALDGKLWLATSGGLYVVGTGSEGTKSATKVVDGSVSSVAADVPRHRVLFGVFADTSATNISATAGSNSMGFVAVHAIDTATRHVTTVGTPLPVGKESIAVVDGQVWVAGYGDGPLLIHLDPTTLRPVGGELTGLTKLDLGPGAVVWPGESVVWVRAGGSEALSCIDPKTGAVLEQWDEIQGPVSSVLGHAYAASDGSLEQLGLVAGCKG
jgi:hypothetical protein